MAEDALFCVSTDAESGQTILGGVGELHLDISVDMLKRIYKVEPNIGGSAPAGLPAPVVDKEPLAGPARRPAALAQAIVRFHQIGVAGRAAQWPDYPIRHRIVAAETVEGLAQEEVGVPADLSVVSPGMVAQIVADLVQWVASVLEHLDEGRIHLDYIDVHLPGRHILRPSLPRTLEPSAQQRERLLGLQRLWARREILVDPRQHLGAAGQDREGALSRLPRQLPQAELQPEIGVQLRERLRCHRVAAVRIGVLVQDLVPLELPLPLPAGRAHGLARSHIVPRPMSGGCLEANLDIVGSHNEPPVARAAITLGMPRKSRRMTNPCAARTPVPRYPSCALSSCPGQGAAPLHGSDGARLGHRWMRR